MATGRRGTAGGLSTSDIDGIRETLAAGRKPKVMFTEAAGQIAGEIGQVVQLTDPNGSDEWVVVQFGRDELPFAPADLTMPPRGRTAKKATGKPAAKEPAKAESQKAPPAPPAVPAPRTDPKPAAKAAPKPAADPAATSAGDTTEPAKAARPAKRAARGTRSAKPKPPSAMTVTLAYESGEWTVAAHQGSKTLAKPYVVRSSEALKMVSMLDVPGVHDAVEAIVSAELAEAAQRAETLRSELAEVEARLADLKDVG